MSAEDQKQTFAAQKPVSALPWQARTNAPATLWPRYHLGRHFQKRKVVAFATHIRIGGRKHAERVFLEQPDAQVIVHVPPRNKRNILNWTMVQLETSNEH